MPSDTIRLYHSTSTPNSRRVRIFLAEKGLSIPLVAARVSSIRKATVRSTRDGSWALVNALAAATGIRLRRLPVDREVLSGRKSA